MPYRHAWLFIVALIAAAVFAFWRSYFGKLIESPVGFHIHGITASLWLLLLLAQSWTPHHRQLGLHRVLGRTMFVAVPLFGAGAMGVIHSMAVATADGDLFYSLWGARLGLMDGLAFGGFFFFVTMALRHRRAVRVHSAYMLATSLMLAGPILGRMANRTIPGLMIRGPQDFPIFGLGAQVGNLVAGAVAVWLWRRDPRAGRPWAIAAAIIAVQIVVFETVARSASWGTAFAALGRIPLVALMLIGLIIGIVAVVIGWARPVRVRRSPAPA